MNGSPKIKSPLFEMNAEEINAYCEDRGKQFSKSVTSSQLRNVFSKIVSLRTFYNNPSIKELDSFVQKMKREITLLKPRLAYAAGREASLKPFQNEMVNLIDETIKSMDIELSQKQIDNLKLETLDNFFTIIEGLVAYHKFYGGK